jgi:hypothetical protein
MPYTLYIYIESLKGSAREGKKVKLPLLFIHTGERERVDINSEKQTILFF